VNGAFGPDWRGFGEIAGRRTGGDQAYGEQVANTRIGLEWWIMSVQFQIEEMPGYVAIRSTGAGTAEEVWPQFELIAKRCESANKNKLLINFTEFQAEISLVDRYFLGERAKISPHHRFKRVAVVDRPERLDPRRFGEMVMLNRWVDASVFTNVEDAVVWLLK
jgi:hypothetical protein